MIWSLPSSGASAASAAILSIDRSTRRDSKYVAGSMTVTRSLPAGPPSKSSIISISGAASAMIVLLCQDADMGHVHYTTPSSAGSTKSREMPYFYDPARWRAAVYV